VLIIVTLVGWSAADIKFTGLTATGTEVAKGVLHGVFHPDTNLMFGTTNTDVPYLLLQTMAIAVLGTLFGACSVGGLLDEEGNIPRMEKAMLADALRVPCFLQYHA